MSEKYNVEEMLKMSQQQNISLENQIEELENKINEASSNRGPDLQSQLSDLQSQLEKEINEKTEIQNKLSVINIIYIF